VIYRFLHPLAQLLFFSNISVGFILFSISL
jgi:hypothetical protein